MRCALIKIKNFYDEIQYTKLFIFLIYHKFLHVAISVVWILACAAINLHCVLWLNRRDADRRCPSKGGGPTRAASSHCEVSLARRERRRFLLHFRHLFHWESVVSNHFPIEFNRTWQKSRENSIKMFLTKHLVNIMIRSTCDNDYRNTIMTMLRPLVR